MPTEPAALPSVSASPTALRALCASAQAYAPTLRVLLAFAGVMIPCLLSQNAAATIPLLLGVIASALAETDDNWRDRLAAQTTTLCCFALVIAAVQSVLGHPALLMAVLAGAAFVLTLAGALGDRYRTMATATLIMALYAALATQASAGRATAHSQEVLLMAGAAWHGLISVGWAAALPMLPVNAALARLYDDLGRTLELKARLFEPLRGIDVGERRLALAQHNGRVVDALNATKESLRTRLHGGHQPPWIWAALHRFFVAQDVHERASSSHEDYTLLADTFFHSDVLYRCQRLLALLGADCLGLAGALRTHRPWTRGDASAQALTDLEAAIAHLERHPGAGETPLPHDETGPAAAPAPRADNGQAQRARRALRSLRSLADNLSAIGRELGSVAAGESRRQPTDTALQDVEPRTLADFSARLRAPLTLASPLLRHAIRLSIALTAGYALMLATGDDYGFWILLTIAFVCQPYYGATLARLAERIAGTVVGLVVGWALLRLFADPLQQAAFIVAAAVLFFAWRTTRYLLATAGITVFVLLALNQVGNGYGLIVPRLLDTLAGSALAGLAVWLILPSWNSPRMPALAAASLRAQSRYLTRILQQYGIAGRDDNLAYRIARRDAHNADAALSGALAASLREPRRVRGDVGAATRVVVLTHTLLNYLSALGAHRDAQLRDDDTACAAADVLHDALDGVAQALETRTPLIDPASARADETDALRALSPPIADEPDFHRIVRAQLRLALDLLPALRVSANELMRA